MLDVDRKQHSRSFTVRFTEINYCSFPSFWNIFVAFDTSLLYRLALNCVTVNNKSLVCRHGFYYVDFRRLFKHNFFILLQHVWLQNFLTNGHGPAYNKFNVYIF